MECNNSTGREEQSSQKNDSVTTPIKNALLLTLRHHKLQVTQAEKGCISKTLEQSELRKRPFISYEFNIFFFWQWSKMWWLHQGENVVFNIKRRFAQQLCHKSTLTHNWRKIGEVQRSRPLDLKAKGASAWAENIKSMLKFCFIQPACYHVLATSPIETQGGVWNETVPWNVFRIPWQTNGQHRIHNTSLS